MSGENISYNLRPNKFVERQLFIDLLRAFTAGESIEQYAYISMGGLQLEDHKLIHHQLGLKTLISIEADPVVFKRQEFNRRPHFIQCTNQKSSNFITNFDQFTQKYSDKRFIVWFDYADANKRTEQLKEYGSLLSKLTSGDLLKITINANPGTLGEFIPGVSHTEIFDRRLTKLKQQLQEFLPEDLSPEDMRGNLLPAILCNAIQKASLTALKATPRLFPVPVSIACYQDENHQMLTVTVCPIEVSKVNDFKMSLERCGWEFSPKDWTDITRIQVPNLSPKERLHIEQKLFAASHEKVHEELPFRFASEDSASLKMFEEYARHYRRYPSYFQVVL